MISNVVPTKDLPHSGGFPLSDSDSISKIVNARSAQEIQTRLAHLDRSDALRNANSPDIAWLESQISKETARTDILRPRVGSFLVSTRSMRQKAISNASATASKISTAVKRLDEEQSRVSATLLVVDQVSELKACVLGVTGSMGAPHDWETAAVYLSRASKIPSAVVDGDFAEKIVPTAEVPESPQVTLAKAAESLRVIFLKEFDKAALEGNGSKVTRFFKLFPLIGKSEVGLDTYGKYICQGVASRARANLSNLSPEAQKDDWSFFSGVLTKLFEHVAQIIENHGGLVERHYGHGSMVKVIQRLQLEIDTQGGIIIDAWNDERSVERRLTDIRSYAFTFLVQSFLPSAASRSGPQRASSPAVRGSAKDLHDLEDETVSMKDCDSIMSEVALMLSAWSLYTRFITTKTNSSNDPSKDLRVTRLLVDSGLHQKVCEKLTVAFNLMATFFFRRSVEKAFQLDEPPTNLSLSLETPLATNPPYITSVVDDVMYILNQILEKIFSTSQKAVVATVIPTISRILSSDFIGMIQRKMRDESYPKAAIQGALPPESIIISFLVLINNLDIATEYTQRIVQTYIGSVTGMGRTEETVTYKVSDRFPFEDDASTVCNVVRVLESSFIGKANELIGDGVFVAFKNIIKPRLRSLLAESFRDVDYQMNAHDLESSRNMAEAEGRRNANEVGVVHDIFRTSWDSLTRPVTRILLPRSTEKLLVITVSYLSELLEKRIWSYYGRINAVGGVRLERDIADILSVVVREGRYRLREAFARCTQICMLMNMEEEEWNELQTGTARMEDGLDWQLDEDERVRARSIL